MSAEAERDPAVAGIAEQIATELEQVLQDSYGTGSRHVQVQISPDLIVAVMDVELTRAEETLLENGKGDSIKMLRESYQEAIGPTFTAIVERASGRRVASFMSMMSVEPTFAVELFRLEPTQEGASR